MTIKYFYFKYCRRCGDHRGHVFQLDVQHLQQQAAIPAHLPLQAGTFRDQDWSGCDLPLLCQPQRQGCDHLEEWSEAVDSWAYQGLQ